MAHALVIGGTGMLRAVCLHLAGAGHAVSVVARSHARLSAVARDAQGLPGRIHPIPADYADDQSLALGIRAAVGANGPVALAVCWIHSTAPRAPLLIAEMIASERRPARYVHVLGSAAAGAVAPLPGRATGSLLPAPPAPPDQDLGRLLGIHYQRVILGFVPGPAGARWLTDEEIGAGVLRAIESGDAETIVGVVHPWSERPRM